MTGLLKELDYPIRWLWVGELQGACPDASDKNLAPEVYVAGNAAVKGHTIDGVSNAFEVAMKI